LFDSFLPVDQVSFLSFRPYLLKTAFHIQSGVLALFYTVIMVRSLGWFLSWVALSAASPLQGRAVDSLNEEATAEAHQRDDTATRAFSNVQIKVCFPHPCLPFKGVDIH
jgi:hypothetical protein